MDFNRFAPFGFDDSARKPALKFNPRHVGFVYSAAMLMYYWSMHFARSGDVEKLEWTQAMARKWRKLQNANTGLLPHFIGSVEADDPDMSPRPYANVQDDKTGVILLKVARELAARPEGSELAALVRQMGMDQLRGIARYGYDPKDRRFVTWIWLDTGKEYTDATFYMFRTHAGRQRQSDRDRSAGRGGRSFGRSHLLARLPPRLQRGIGQARHACGSCSYDERPVPGRARRLLGPGADG